LYQHTRDTLYTIRDLNIQSKELLFDELKAMGYKPYKSEANFILCDFGAQKRATPCDVALVC
jgi:histidinol-phosphate/aromatic aminotransferase/cobyric acid decarboxylase-like protein